MASLQGEKSRDLPYLVTRMITHISDPLSGSTCLGPSLDLQLDIFDVVQRPSPKRNDRAGQNPGEKEPALHRRVTRRESTETTYRLGVLHSALRNTVDISLIAFMLVSTRRQ